VFGFELAQLVPPETEYGTVADLLRLLLVPAFGYAAYRDIRTRRVDGRLWAPLVLVGLVALALDFSRLGTSSFSGERLLVRVGVSLGLVGSLGYLFWRLGAFGGADAKAIMTISLCFPAYPNYVLPGVGTLPDHRATLGVFSLTILTNTVLAGLAYPLVLAAGNALRGRFGLPMFVGRPVRVAALAGQYGRLLETPDGFSRGGLDLDTLRMYLRWRGTTLSAVRDNPGRFRDPDSLPAPEARGDPTSGSVAEGDPVADGGRPVTDGGGPVTDGGDPAAPGPAPSDTADVSAPTPAVRRIDAWGAAAFLDDVGYAYGDGAADIREGLDLLTDPGRERVWVSPGIPFVVPMFAGLVVALTVGDLLLLVLGLF
jgi:preflagellin peptidase FlaK